MASSRIAAVHAAAARNNAVWCAAVCRSHGIAGTFGDSAWCSARRPPPYFPDAVTLRPDAVPADFLPAIDTASPASSIKDSFAALDLTADGYTELFSAQWIHRAAGLPVPPAPALRVSPVVTESRLGDWQAAWHGGAGAPDVFRPALLEDPAVVVLAVRDGEALAGGVVLTRGADVVGLSNLFATGRGDVAAVWSAAISAAAERYPGMPLVGYEHGADLEPAIAAGFVTLGALRVWRHG
ncbi:hypothetical protein [Dactylosporangium sp. NPDC051541]|uniref:hypothetical protein n=1 Tax=Dactylosporangium sp. NPDC051541 TaxID=3363977 RepID=UPI0037AD9720